MKRKPLFDENMINAILAQVILALVIGFIIHTLCHIERVLVPEWIRLRWWTTFSIGGTCVALLLGYTRWVKWWFVIGKQNTMLVYSKTATPPEIKDTDEQLTKLSANDDTMHVIIGPVLAALPPLVRPYKAITTERSVSVIEEPQKVTTKDGVPVQVLLRVNITAIGNERGAKALARHNEAFVRAQIAKISRLWAESEVRTMSVDELFEAIYVDPDNPTGPKIRGADHLKNRFSKLFGGSGVISITEWQFGVFTGEILIEFILDEEYQAAMKALASSEKLEQAIKKLTRTGMKPAIAANLAAQMAKLQMPAKVVEIITPDQQGRSRGNNPGNSPVLVLKLDT